MRGLPQKLQTTQSHPQRFQISDLLAVSYKRVSTIDNAIKEKFNNMSKEPETIKMTKQIL
jgi:hypothetical protein